MLSGLRLAVLYGFYPHQLGLCGPGGAGANKLFEDFLLGKNVSKKKVRKALEQFRAAYSYYKLIAKSNKIKDPFDKRVVCAYWIGNKFLDKVSAKSLREMIVHDFSGHGLLPKQAALEKAKNVSVNSLPHHNFHVLVIGSVTGKIDLGGRLADICRVSWGQVLKVKGGKKQEVIVKYAPLRKIGSHWKLGKVAQKTVFWNSRFLPGLKTGDVVTMHWNHVIEKINKKQLANLIKYTNLIINNLQRSFL